MTSRLASAAKAWTRRLESHAQRAGWAATEALVGPVALLLISPWLLRQLGAEGFGLWALAVSISSFGSLASLGVGLTTTKHVAADLADKLPGQAIIVTRAGLTVALALGGSVLVLGSLATPWLGRAVFAKMGEPATVALALTAGLCILVLQEVDAVFAGALRGASRFDAVAKIELLSRPVWLSAVAGTAWATNSVNATLAASLGANGLRLMMKAAAANAILGGACTRPTGDKEAIARMVKFGTWVWIQGIGAVMFSVVDRLLVGSMFGAVDLGRYTLCMQLAQFVHSLQSAALQTVVPWVSGRAMQTGRSSFRPLKQVALLGGLACMVAPLAFALASHGILALWISTPFADDNHQLVLLLFASVVILSFSTPGYFVLMGLGDVRFVGLLAIGAGVLALATSVAVASWTALAVSAFALGRSVYGLVNVLALPRLWRLGRQAERLAPAMSSR